MIIRIPSCKESKKRKRDVILLQGQVLTSIFPLRKLFSEIHFFSYLFYLELFIYISSSSERQDRKDEFKEARGKKMEEIYRSVFPD